IVTRQAGKVKQATGIIAQGKEHHANIIVSNADVYTTHHHLLPEETKPERILNQEKSSSALIFYWGINTVFPQLDLHNILFSRDYYTEFEHITNEKFIYYDPTIYINITSKYKPDDAPPGSENWFVMINVPNNSGQNWDQLIIEARKNIIKKINRVLQTDLSKHIVCEEILDPRSIESKTASHLGALYGNASNNNYAAFMRHANFSKHIKGLYFCGGSVHPGGGIPLCLNSAKIVSRLVQENYG
ncbi:MAG: phytoene desaturase, partial [Bacteroidetes bacterium]